MSPLRAIRFSRAAAAVEFALLAPLLVALLVAIVDLGLALKEWMRVHYAAQAGAQFAGRYGWDAAGIAAAVELAGSNSEITANPQRICGCPGASGIVAVDCATPCADGAGPNDYAMISAQSVYTTILSYPGLANPLVLSAEALARIE